MLSVEYWRREFSMSIDDLLGRPTPKDKREKIDDLGGICECFWPVDYGLYDKATKRLTFFCTNPEETHETTIEMDLGDGRR